MNDRRAFVPIASLVLASCAAIPPGADVIAPDRPGFLLGTSLVRPGVTNVELGVPSVAWDRSGSHEVTASSTPVQLRYGLNERVELRADIAPWNRLHDESSNGSSTDTGIGDVETGMKIALADGTGDAPKSVVVANVRWPTGADAFSVDDPAFSAAASASKALDATLTAGAMLGYSEVRVFGSAIETATLAAALNRALDERWTVYVESAWIVDLGDGPDAVYGGGGCSVLLSPDVQLDASFDRGLNDDAADWLFGLGFSTRW